MNWTDEHYVKLYTRRTATRELWPWQARALHPNLMLVLDKSGVLDVGARDVVRSVAVLVSLPVEVVAPGLDALVEDGTVAVNDGKLVMPKFLEAQEARKTNGAAARHHREKVRDLASAKAAGLLEPTVIDRHQPSSGVTLRPRPLPDPDPVPEILAGKLPPATPKTPKAKPVDPRHAPLVKALVDAYAEAEYGARYGFLPIDARHVSELLRLAGPEPDAGEMVVHRWREGMALKFNPIKTLAKLVQRWNEVPAVRASEVPPEMLRGRL